MRVLGLDISKLSATYWLLDTIPDDPKSFSRKTKQQKLEVSQDGREKLLAMDFDFAVLEPTGIYSRIWRHWLKQANRDYRLVGHWELKSYREGWKIASKTDKLDGLAMAMYGLERHSRPASWLVERDYQLSDLINYHSHLNEQKNGYQNNLRQKLAWQLPEWHDRKIGRAWRGSVPGILNAIAGEPSEKWQREIENSCGVGLDRTAASLARILIQIEEEEILAEQWIDAELEKDIYKPYVEAARRCGFSHWLTAVMISSIYPFEQFLVDGKRKITHYLSQQNSKRVYKDESLRSFKLACGVGLVWVQSGEFQGWVAGGNGKTRENLRNSVQASYLNNKLAIKRGWEEKEEMSLVKHKYDNRGMMKVARRWIENFYKELVKEFC